MNRAAKLVLDFADSLPGPYGHERSIKFDQKCSAGQRFLVTFPSVALEMGADLAGLLQQLNCPSNLPVDDLIRDRAILHLGVEGSGTSAICKLYAEDADTIRQLWSETRLPQEPVPVHRSLKWRLDTDQWVATDYDWLPCQQSDQLLGFVRQYVPDSLPLLRLLLAQVPADCPVSHLQLLRVTEAQNPRLSLDLNLYDSQLSVSVLLEVLRQLNSEDPYGSLLLSGLSQLNGIADQLLGHLAFGVARDGSRFITVYYGVEERGSFS